LRGHYEERKGVRMGKQRMIMLALMATLLWATGCSTTSDVLKAKSEGTSQVYPVNADQAWKIARTVFRWEGADAIEEHRDENYMLTSSGRNLISEGTVMGAWVDPVDKNNTKVTIVTKRRITTNIAGGGRWWGSVSDLLNFINFATFFPCRAIPASTLPGCSTT